MVGNQEWVQEEFVKWFDLWAYLDPWCWIGYSYRILCYVIDEIVYVLVLDFMSLWLKV